MAVKTKQQLIDQFKALFVNNGTGSNGKIRPTHIWEFLTDLIDTIFSFVSSTDLSTALAGKMDKASPVATGTIQGTGTYPTYVGSAEGMGNSTSYVGFNAKRNNNNTWTIGGDSVGSNGGGIIFSDIDGDMLWVKIPSTGVGTPQTLTDAAVLALSRPFGEPDANKADKDLSINTQTASYTLALTDRGGKVRMNVASANTLTVPPNSAVAFPIGTQILIRQVGAGQTTIVAGSGVTLNSGDGLKFSKQHTSASIVKVATNEWDVAGGMTA